MFFVLFANSLAHCIKLYKCGASGNLCNTIVQTISGFLPGTSSENEQQCNSQDSSSLRVANCNHWKKIQRHANTPKWLLLRNQAWKIMDILKVRIPSVQWIIKTKYVPNDRTVQFHGLIQVPESLHRKILASTSCTKCLRKANKSPRESWW
jgi:hypothetical protein